MPFPSYYQTDIDRARERSQRLQKEMGGAEDRATGALTTMQALQDKLSEDAMARERLDLEQKREDRIAAFGRGGGAGGGVGGGGKAAKGAGLPNIPDLKLDSTAVPMTMQQTLDAKLRMPMSTLPKEATSQVADVGDIMQKAGLDTSTMGGEVSADPERRTAEQENPDRTAAFQKIRTSVETGEPTPEEAEAAHEKEVADAKDRKTIAEAPKAEALAKIAERKANVTGKASNGLPSTKQQMADLKLQEEKLKLAKMQGGPKSKIDPGAMDARIREAEELASIYESGKLNETGGELLDPEHHPMLSAKFSSPERNRARQLATGLSLGVPSAFSGSTRLNNTEFVHSLKSIVGAPDTSMSNEDKAKMARSLVADLKAMKAEMTSGAPGPTAESAGGGAPAAPVQHSSETVDAAAKFYAMPPDQQAKVKALIKSGVDRTAAVQQVLGGG